jgi:glycosyltransferase involved in cell wall biosynthesis
MKVLVVHNRYRERGGEDAAVDDEIRLLREHGHELRLYERSNHQIDEQPRWRSAAETLWSGRSAREVGRLIDDWQPDLVHVHNTFALVSPAVLGAAARRGTAVVATLHNYRLGCLEGTFLRDRSICELCLGKLPWRGVAWGCYRSSRAQSAVLAGSLMLHRALRSWQRHVHRFIVLSEGARGRFERIGIPRERISVRPNFAWAPPSAPAAAAPREGGLYVGRLAREKGIAVMCAALARASAARLTVVGDGPERDLLAATRARWLGPLPSAAVQQQMLRAAWLVVPSITLEQFPRVLAEAYAAGLPVIASDLGPLAEWVHEGRTGLLFEAGNAAALAERFAWAESHPQQMREMGEQARRVYERALDPAAAYRSLIEVYRSALTQART